VVEGNRVELANASRRLDLRRLAAARDEVLMDELQHGLLQVCGASAVAGPPDVLEARKAVLPREQHLRLFHDFTPKALHERVGEEDGREGLVSHGSREEVRNDGVPAR
jgi:hypothetical protein